MPVGSIAFQLKCENILFSDSFWPNSTLRIPSKHSQNSLGDNLQCTIVYLEATVDARKSQMCSHNSQKNCLPCSSSVHHGHRLNQYNRHRNHWILCLSQQLHDPVLQFKQDIRCRINWIIAYLNSFTTSYYNANKIIGVGFTGLLHVSTATWPANCNSGDNVT